MVRGVIFGLCALALVLAQGCDDATGTHGAADAADAGDAPLARDGDGAELPLAADAVDGGGPDGVTVVCEPAARWEAGAPLFDEVTEAWGLRALGVEGTRISVTDLDGDGRPDLLVRRGIPTRARR